MDKYYPNYTINPESIYGSGIINTNKFPVVDTTVSVITDSFPKYKQLTPPLYKSGVSKDPLITNGYRILKENDNSKKMDRFYYSSQQHNKDIIPDIQTETKLSSLKTKTVKKLNNIKNTVERKMSDIGRNKNMWIDDHYLYSLEPRYTSVVNPWRAYTWMYPIAPNSDNYYIDNINSSPIDPIIVSNDSQKRLNWQGTYLQSNLLKDNFDTENNQLQNNCNSKYNQKNTLLDFISI